MVGSNVAALELEIGEIPKLKKDSVVELENWIDEMEKDLEPLGNFILPGGSKIASQCFLARAVCRRAERVFISIKEHHSDVDPLISKYLNRLSDVLFVLARWLNKEVGIEDINWEK